MLEAENRSAEYRVVHISAVEIGIGENALVKVRVPEGGASGCLAIGKMGGGQIQREEIQPYDALEW